MIKTKINLVPDITNPSPDYYCTWQTQLYATSDGKPPEQRKAICERSMFERKKPYGWSYFYEQARSDLLFIMDDSWDMPLSNDEAYFGSLILNKEKFPSFVKENDDGLKALTDKMKSLGWKGLGGWVCAQESRIYSEGLTPEQYWTERLIAAHKAGFSYWKVDWGGKGLDIEYRRMLTELARIHAPELTVEHAIVKDVIPYSDTFRTYDVPALMSIPMTFEKLACFGDTPEPIGQNSGILNCEDEAYIAAAGGYAMGIMRHPYSGAFPNGKADMSFPCVHRDLKTKMYEVIRATRWHRIAPAFSGGSFLVSSTVLEDNWKFENVEEELEAWWLKDNSVGGFIKDGILTKSAPSALARDTALPLITPDSEGNIPYCIASLNPNGVYSIATSGRTLERRYFIPKCDISADIGNADTVGIFGEYASLSLNSRLDIKGVLMQDLASNTAFDVTKDVQLKDGKVIISGELISRIGTSEQPDGDTSEPGVIVKLIV